MRSIKILIAVSFIVLGLVLGLSFYGFCQTAESLLLKEVKIFESKKTLMVEQIIELAARYQIPMGIEAIYDPGEKQSSPIRMENTTVQEVLREILRENLSYSLQVTDGVIHVFPRSIVSDPRNFLNLRIPQFNLKEKSLLDALVELKLAMNMLLHPEKHVHGYGGGGGAGLDPASGFDIRNITLEGKYLIVREILNQLILLNGNALWVVNFLPDQMMEAENFFAQTSYRFPGRKDIRGFYWEFVPLQSLETRLK